MKLLLIDAYAMIFRAYYAFIRQPRLTSKGENTSAIFGFVVTLEDLIKRLNPTHVGVAFDPPGPTFRHEAYPQYKAQREETPEDIRKAVPIIKKILEAMRIPVLEVPGYEADDVVGALAKQAEAKGYTVYMATPDKDYGQLVSDKVRIYRPRHTGGFEELGPQEVCEKYGLNSHLQVIDLLALMGDTADNVPGCKGVGEKTAVKLLQDFGSIDNLLAHTDQIKGALRTKVEQQREDILFSKYLVTICTDVPITLDDEALLRCEPDMEALVRLYSELEFRSLLKKFDTAPAPVKAAEKASKPAAGQLDLFAPATAAEPTLFDVQTEQPSLFAAAALPEVAPMHIPADAGYITDDLKRDLHAKTTHVNAREAFDVTLAHYLLQPEMAHELDYLCDVYLHQRIGESAESKQAALYLLKEKLAALLHEDDRLWHLFAEVEMPLVQVLADMEDAGVRFDTQVLSEASETLTAELRTIEQQIYADAGEIFNINSPKQVGDILFQKMRLDEKAKRTKAGSYSTSEEILQGIKDRHPIVGRILDYRALSKLIGTYLDALPKLINPSTGKIHTTYNQTVTATGRLSSSNPNLQNLPIRSERGKEIRRAVIPDDGCLFLSADYSQIELRLMAHLSGDEHMLAAFRSGQDIHAATAAKIFGCPIEEVTKDMRRRAKTANFGILYGISAFGLAQQLDCPRSEAKQLIDGYFLAFPGVVDWIEQAKQLARERGYAETMFGRRRYLPDMHSHNATVRSFAERNAVNAPVQGSAADIIKIAMVRIADRLKAEHLQAQMIMQVHDELNFCVPASEVERVRAIVVEEMQGAVSLQVPLIAECGVGKNWLEAH